MTVLLVLAIGASSALVFTNRVELLKLAVILALWAAVVAAFVSVVFRRQSDSDQAKVRDLKLVYDLQLDREISARREYELSVETQLRRELAAELRAQQSDEVAALRAELAALRANLEFLFDADLSHRHAIGTERNAAREIGPWTPRPDTAGRVSSSRIDTEDAEEVLAGVGAHDDSDTQESPIIDVPAEPHPPESEPVPAYGEPYGGHRVPAEEPHSRHRAEAAAQGQWAPPPPRAVPPEPHLPWLPPQARPPEGAAPAAQHWRPAPAEGQWIPAGEPGSNWVAGEARPGDGTPGEYVGRRRAPEAPQGRHSTAGDVPVEPPPPPMPEEPEGEQASDGAHTGGQSVADLLARLQVSPSGGGRRRRRED